MIDLLAFAAFVAFVLIGVWVRRSGAGNRRSRVLVVYVLTLFLGVNATQVDLWPFTRFIPASFAPDPTEVTSNIEFAAVDRTGREWPVDMRVFSPVTPWVMNIWIVRKIENDEAPDALMGDLLSLANRGRARLAEGRRIGPQRVLGPFAIPFWLLHGRYEDVPDESWKGLRVYETRFVPERFGGRLEKLEIIERRLLREWIDEDFAKNPR